jgi:hypothetical protein
MSKYLNRTLLAAMVIGMAYRSEAVESATGASAAPTPAAATAVDAAAPVAPTTLSAEEQAKVDASAAEAKANLHTAIKAKFNNLVDIKETNFHFRKVTDEKTKIVTKRPTISLPIPVPSVEGVVEIFNAGGKGLELLMEAVASVIMEQAREYINEHDPVNEANFPFEKMSWEVIANLPKAERRGGGISKEVWEEFAKDYVEVMPAVTGKTKEQVELAAKVFVAKFAGATTNKPVLKVLQGQLALYAQNTTQGEQFAACIEFLSDKLEKLLSTDETNLLLAL